MEIKQKNVKEEILSHIVPSLGGDLVRWFLIFKLSVARGDLVAPGFLGLV